MANYFIPFSVPGDGAWHTVVHIKSSSGWCEMTVLTGEIEFAVTSLPTDTPPLGHPLKTLGRWTADAMAGGYVRARAVGGAADLFVNGRE